MEQLIVQVDESARLAAAIVIIIWVGIFYYNIFGIFTRILFIDLFVLY